MNDQNPEMMGLYSLQLFIVGPANNWRDRKGRRLPLTQRDNLKSDPSVRRAIAKSGGERRKK